MSTSGNTFSTRLLSLCFLKNCKSFSLFRQNMLPTISGRQLGEASHRLVVNSLQIKGDRGGYGDHMNAPPPPYVPASYFLPPASYQNYAGFDQRHQQHFMHDRRDHPPAGPTQSIHTPHARMHHAPTDPPHSIPSPHTRMHRAATSHPPISPTGQTPCNNGYVSSTSRPPYRGPNPRYERNHGYEENNRPNNSGKQPMVLDPSQVVNLNGGPRVPHIGQTPTAGYGGLPAHQPPAAGGYHRGGGRFPPQSHHHNNYQHRGNQGHHQPYNNQHRANRGQYHNNNLHRGNNPYSALDRRPK